MLFILKLIIKIMSYKITNDTLSEDDTSALSESVSIETSCESAQNIDGILKKIGESIQLPYKSVCYNSTVFHVIFFWIKKKIHINLYLVNPLACNK